MASHSLPFPFRARHGQAQAQAPIQALSLRTVLVALIGLLILFQWLHLILALQIASTGRQIQVKTEELHRIERQNALLQYQTAEAGSPRQLAIRALGLGYRPREAVYLPMTAERAAQPAAGLADLRVSSEPASGAATRLGLIEAIDRAFSTWSVRAAVP